MSKHPFGGSTSHNHKELIFIIKWCIYKKQHSSYKYRCSQHNIIEYKWKQKW